MKPLLNFLIEVGKLKKMPRTGWVLRGVKRPETIAAHTFRMALMAWILCYRKQLDVDKAIKMSLIHDLCEIYAGDATPFDKILPRDKQKRREMLNSWPRLSKAKKEKIYREKYKKEDKALKKLIADLPPKLKREMTSLWEDYERGLTREGRFVRQLDRVENLLQAFEYWSNKKQFAIKSWWIQVEELVDDPTLFEFMQVLEKKFCKKKKRKPLSGKK